MEVEAFCSSDESLVKVQAEHEAAKSTFLEVSSHWNSISKDMVRIFIIKWFNWKSF